MAPGDLETDKSVGAYLRALSGDLIPDSNQISGFQRLNYFTFFLQSGCFGVQHLMVDVIFSAALEAAIATVDFDELDAIRFFFRPKGLFRKGHVKGKGGLRSLSRKSGILAAYQDAKYSGAGKTLWRWDTIGQRVLFWFFVWDTATNFVYNFSSLAIQNKNCEGGSAGGHMVGGGTLLTLGAWFGGGFTEVDYQGGGVSMSSTAFNVISRGGYSGAGYNFVEKTGDFPCTVGLRGTYTGAGGPITVHDFTTVGPGGGGSVAANIGFPSNGVVVWELSSLGTAMGIGGDAFCVGNEVVV